MDRTRTFVLAAGIAALVALVLLSASLAQLRLAPGSQLPAVAHEAEEAGPGGGPAILDLFDEAGMELFFRVFYVLVLVLLAASIVALIVSPEMRKQTLARLIPPLLLLIFLLLIRDKANMLPAPATAVPAEPGADVVAESGPTVRFDAKPPKSVVWGTRIAAGIGVAVILGGALWLLWRSRRSPAPHPLEQVAEQARKAIQAIEAGADVRNVILRCYFEMGRVLSEEKGLVRQCTMTPREFEHSLAATGLPEPAVQSLTRLFEAVRYGSKATSGAEEEQALRSLTAIVDACRTEA